MQKVINLKNSIIFGLFIILILLPLIVFLSQTQQIFVQHAATNGNIYYVSKNGNNADGKSWQTAWNELNNINWSVIQPGDTIFLDGGTQSMTYVTTLTIGKSGIQGLPITIERATEAGHNGHVIFFGGRSTPLPYCGQSNYTYQPATLSYGVVVGANSWVVIDGMKWDGISLYGFSTHGVEMVNNPSNITLRNMEIYDIGVAIQSGNTWSPDTNGHGVYLTGSNLTFERMNIHDVADDAFDGGEPNGPVHNVIINNSWMYVSREDPNTPGLPFDNCTHQDGYQIYDGGDHQGPITIENSVIGPGLGENTILGATCYPPQGACVRAGVDNVTLRNVLSIGKDRNILGFPQIKETGWVIDHVTAISPGSGIPGGTYEALFLQGTGNTVTNSIFYDGLVYLPDGLTNSSGNCQWNLISGNAIIGQTVDPKFTTDISSWNYSTPYAAQLNGDYSLQPSSLCKGAGSSITSIAQFLSIVNTQPSNAPSSSPVPTQNQTPFPSPTQGVSPQPTSPCVPASSPMPTDTPFPSMPTNTPFPSGVSPTGINYCGQTCVTNADCDTSGVTCGICDLNANVCVGGQATGTPVPTGNVSLTPSPLPTASPTLGPAVGTLSLHFEGIDPQNNPSPYHPQRAIVLSFYQSQNFTQNPVAVLSEMVTFSQSDPDGAFVNNSIDLSSIPQGSYYVLVKYPAGSLQEEVNNNQPVTIANGQTVSLNGTTPVSLSMGDLNNDNVVDLKDYNILVDCFGKKATSPSCASHKLSDPLQGLLADITDNGTVDGIDYNILIKNFGMQGVGNVQNVGVSQISPFDATPCTSPTAITTPTPTQVPSPTAPSGTKQTITSYGWGGSAVYQPAGSPWWALNNAWGGPPPNTQAIDYYPNTFPNSTTLRWSYGGSGGNVLGYPEIIIGDQNGQTIRPPNGVEPAWYGKTLGSLSHLILSWDIVINAQNGDNWDILFENHMMGHETGIFLKDPWVRSGNSFSNLGGISGIGLPNCWATGSFCIVPSTVLAGTPMLKGSIDLLPIFKWAISNGWMSSNESVYGWEFGVEPTNGSGSVTFNSLSVDIQ